MSSQLTLSYAAQGLKRFFEVMRPARITWGTIYRTEASEAGLRRLNKVEAQIKICIKKANYFLSTQSPRKDEHTMVLLYLESLDDRLCDIRVRRDYIQECIKHDRALEQRVSDYERPKLFDTRHDADEIPF